MDWVASNRQLLCGGVGALYCKKCMLLKDLSLFYLCVYEVHWLAFRTLTFQERKVPFGFTFVNCGFLSVSVKPWQE